MSDFPSFDCAGAVIGGRWSLLEVIEYAGRDNAGHHKWLVRCLTCDTHFTRRHNRLMTHAWRDGDPTNYCFVCKNAARGHHEAENNPTNEGD